MKLKELFTACSQLGDFPEVEIASPVRHSKLTCGKIVEINNRGIAVHFPDMKWNTWFFWESGTDKRSHYAIELSLKINTNINNQNI